MTRGLSMSEFGQLAGNPTLMQGDAVAAGAGGSAGVLLRQAREAAGLHIAALAVALKVPVKKLEALEADRFDLLPDAVFVRALAASVCRTLKIDAAQVLALLPQTGKPRLGHPQTAINTPFRSPSDGPGPSLWSQISRPAVMAGLLLVLGALVLIFLPAAQPSGTAAAPAAEPSAAVGPAGAASVASSGGAVAGTDVLDGGKPASGDAAAAPLVSAPALAPTLSAPPLPSVGGIVPASVSPPPAGGAEVGGPAGAAPAATTGIIVFKAKGESWVEVTDAKGVVVLRRTLTTGEAAGATGALPLSAVVGRVDATQVQVRGQAFDLNAVSKDNVARFEVK